MIRAYLLTYIFLFFTALSFGIAQEQTDTAAQQQTLMLNEAIILKDQQQKQIDSLVKIQLQRELQLASGNARRTEELEQKLRQIKINDSLRTIQQMEKIKSLKKTTVGYPVVLNTDTLFHVFTRTGSFQAKDRASAISLKIENLYKDPFFSPDSLVLVQNEDNFDVIYKDRQILLTVTPIDGLWFGKSNQELAGEYLQIVREVIVRERDAHSLINWLKRIGLVLLIILVLSFIVAGINRLFARSALFMSAAREKYISSLSIRNVKIFSPEHVEYLLLRINNIARILTILLAIYLSLPVLFSIFPETEAWTGTLLGWVLAPIKAALNAVVQYLPNLFTIAVIYYIFKYILKGIKYLFFEIKRENIRIRGFHTDWAVPTFNILRFMLYAFMLVLIFPYLPGSDSPAFQGVSVFLGILFSLGSSSAINNIVAGLVITYMRPFKIGDRVKIGEVTGDIVEKSMLVTRIRTIKNEDITVPNSMVLTSSTVNYSNHTRAERQGLIVHYTVTVGYDVPWKQVYDLLIEAALKAAHILEEPKPFVLQISLDDYYVSYQINAYTREANKQAVIYSSLLENIQDVFGAAGIEILSPVYNVMRTEESKE
ncbi:mechanosensitive ion channel-like protein [Arcticibacter pallidicorallinus]|uniref:Mechanosensitive ion channel-like protein n=1 Tax=Arcticibacter pallidicorallinus TaxID=1259464 RepID=A0A2T0U3P7_9SPHI|nr:mechanosensitive ion channel family protein [Arcticibacter pallidicorallinus]PRY52549.1 mechanosensitive ion channel-like protein [Arcticibacter pallidicorallinus]